MFWTTLMHSAYNNCGWRLNGFIVGGKTMSRQTWKSWKSSTRNQFHVCDCFTVFSFWGLLHCLGFVNMTKEGSPPSLLRLSHYCSSLKLCFLLFHNMKESILSLFSFWRCALKSEQEKLFLVLLVLSWYIQKVYSYMLLLLRTSWAAERR